MAHDTCTRQRLTVNASGPATLSAQHASADGKGKVSMPLEALRVLVLARHTGC